MSEIDDRTAVATMRVENEDGDGEGSRRNGREDCSFLPVQLAILRSKRKAVTTLILK